ncbi:hypothetical protein [Spirosoma fluviale]|uniref:Uncharacterized protein n=1 Tax=Spirosoma fluviale TaxID=1597977 RepID=A0A286GN21_9BACT|nr:hypothetical protein [Spirosoma fluviale]SOD96951.1 hypothetical protein SAMN06269250_5586 [Spirosoma fluviale]
MKTFSKFPLLFAIALILCSIKVSAQFQLTWTPGVNMKASVVNMMAISHKLEQSSQFGFTGGVCLLGAFLREGKQVGWTATFEAGTQYVIIAPQLKYIPFASTGAERNFGIANPEADSSLAILIYSQTDSQMKSYQFDDTLRLYGNFDNSKLRLIYIPATGVYLLEDSTSIFTLKRTKTILPIEK